MFWLKYKDEYGGYTVWVYKDLVDAESELSYREECDKREGYYVEDAYEIIETDRFNGLTALETII